LAIRFNELNSFAEHRLERTRFLESNRSKF
jgi:hypothetical protein